MPNDASELPDPVDDPAAYLEAVRARAEQQTAQPVVTVGAIPVEQAVAVAGVLEEHAEPDSLSGRFAAWLRTQIAYAREHWVGS